MKIQIDKIEQPSAGDDAEKDDYITTSQVPELGAQYARLLRGYKIQESLFEMLLKQYEVAKITEAKNTSTIQLIDSAVRPDQKSKPNRTLIVLAVTSAAAFCSMFAAFVLESLNRLSAQDQELWRQIKAQLQLRSRVDGSVDLTD